MSGYAAWWSFAWGWIGALAFPNDPTPEIERERKAMALLNSIAHPIYMFPSILVIVIVIVFGQGRWVLPLMVFVIGAHLLPMARILDRKIDYLLGPVTMIVAIGAGLLALDETVAWLVVFAVAGIGGAVSTLCYALYLAREYRRLCDRASVPFP
ncbi:MAG: hypothetical protein QM677_10060 [Microbacterium sp.]